MLTTIIGHVLAVCVGLSLGLLGGGGAILAVPILVYVMGINAKTAIAMSLITVCIISLIGLIPHWQQGNVNLKTALAFTPAAMLGAYLGAKLTTLPIVTDTIQLVSFGLIMAIASALMIRRSHSKNVSISSPAHKFISTLPPWVTIPGEGLGVGILTGFVGVGGGFMIVPALVMIEGLPIKTAIGTSLIIIAANSVAGFLGYLNEVAINWQLVVSFTVAASGGTIVGAYLNRYIEAKALQKGFGYFILAVAIFVLIKR